MNKVFQINCRKCFFFLLFSFYKCHKKSLINNRKVICLILFLKMNTDKILSKIRSKRQLLNYSQDYVASVLQMKQANYNKIENGKVDLSVSVLFKIARLLDLNVDELIKEYKAA